MGHNLTGYVSGRLLRAPALDAAVLIGQKEPAVGGGDTVPGGEYVQLVLGELGTVVGGGCP